MIAKQLITGTVVPLKPADSWATALSLMDDYRLSQLPLVDEKQYHGLISEKDIFDRNDFDAPIGSQHTSLAKPYTEDYKHVFDVIRLFTENKLNVLPVLDRHKKYMGCITLAELIDFFSKSASIANPGGIIVLEMSYKDYSLSEIAQIVESNDAKVLSFFVSTHNDSTRLEVSLKLNKIEIGSIIQTFNRYDYVIKASYTEKEDMEDLQDRYESFMKYLNI
ncbi:MAG: CBS domain-containing protein [Bacteroidales bacterium]|nr:CBS domain-containing protein [Bacteroidales bacterium]MCF8351430.1 CBS domain-containing protein [Bacteroidales bacterium]MCF8374773.1 CBS domain-containing protein [Bacteroidales bacterium]MCF8399823.1 CBS domain-containing protein [Bacteroidales bacterium]